MRQLNFLDELIIDNFAGGGGASCGIELATGRPVDIAINHDPDAIAMHKANHPYTRHYQESVWDINPKEICQGHKVGLAWFSPDCKHFSKAKGGKPVDKNIRGLAWIVLKWAGTVRPSLNLKVMIAVLALLSVYSILKQRSRSEKRIFSAILTQQDT